MSELFFVDRDVSLRRGPFEIVLILDRSGSMSNCKEDTIEGINEFLRQQKELKDPCRITIAQFDDQYEVLYDGADILDVPYFTEATFVPRGGTALLDAVGRTLSVLDGRLAGMEEGETPRKVMITIVTDGGENRSQEFKLEGIKKTISDRKETGWWDFHFIGADINAFGAARSFGIGHAQTMSVDKASFGGRGMSSSLASLSTSYTISRGETDDSDSES